ncbi:MAG: hypothetical protein WCK16_04130 [Candidatus Moraniibacteriota bacterium]
MKNNFEQSRQNNISADYVRHSQAGYKSYAESLKNNPTAPFDKNEQVIPDITEGGMELAKNAANEYFKDLDPNKTDLFFVSSNEARAVETANIYRETAKENGFNVIVPENSRSKISDENADGEIRILETLSLNHPNILANMAFSPKKYRVGINFDNVSDEEKKRFEQATAIIDAEDQGSYAKNFEKYSEQVQSIFPDIKSAHDLYTREFENMKRLLRFANKKTQASNLNKDVKILAFGHENMLIEAIREKFQEDGINNCEVLRMKLADDGSTEGEFRGKKGTL